MHCLTISRRRKRCCWPNGARANGCPRSSRSCSAIASAAGRKRCPKIRCCWAGKTSSRRRQVMRRQQTRWLPPNGLPGDHLPLLRERVALDRRRQERAAGPGASAVPGARHKAAQIRLPIMRGRRHPGAGSSPADRGRIAGRGHGCAGAGIQICRSSAAVPAGPDLHLAGYRSGSLNAGGLRQSCRLATVADETTVPVLDPVGAAPRPGSSGPMPPPTGHGAAPIPAGGGSYVCAPDGQGRAANRPSRRLQRGILQVDGLCRLPQAGRGLRYRAAVNWRLRK